MPRMFINQFFRPLSAKQKFQRGVNKWMTARRRRPIAAMYRADLKQDSLKRATRMMKRVYRSRNRYAPYRKAIMRKSKFNWRRA